MNLEKHLTKLCEAPGLSGYEAPVRVIIQREWDKLAQDLTTDNLGNLSALRPGSGKEPRRKVLVTAHMDEIGLMVTQLEGEFLRFTSVAGIDERVLLGQPVIVQGERALPGLIGSRPPHVLPASERSAYPKLTDLVIDTGQSANQLKKLVNVGTPVTFDQPARALGAGLLSAKALDNRASVAALTLILEGFQGRSHAWDVVVAATVQEESGLVGGETIAWQMRPDLAIVIDVGWAIGDGVSEDEGFKLGGGPTLVIGPNAHPKLFDLLLAKAEELEIDLHPEPMPRSSGTEAWAIQISRDGVPTAILSIPIRNMHTPVEVVALKDIERVARLVIEFVVGLDDKTLDKLALDGDEAVR